MFASGEVNHLVQRVVSKLNLPQESLYTLLLFKIHFQTSVTEQLVWSYLSLSKGKVLLKALNINYCSEIVIPASSLAYCSDYAAVGRIDAAHGQIFNYYGLLIAPSAQVVSYLSPTQHFFSVLASAAKEFNTAKALYQLRMLDSSLSASGYNFYWYAGSFVVTLVLGVCMCPMQIAVMTSIVSLFHNIVKYFLYVLSLTATSRLGTKAEFMPIYTVLVPMYLEARKIQFVINSMSKLYYPKNRLDVKLVIEEDDVEIQKVLLQICLPEYFHVVTVPASIPRTKPKALNYAVQYAAGSYVTIFDAEDYPDPKQLVTALAGFNYLPSRYVCLQARLNFYNRNESLITRMQSIEYSIWFDYLLPGLYRAKQFIPLGGTSCHFKADVLRRLGCWDAFNVTEDLDLGVRIYVKGYFTGMIDSVTLEEATISISSWLRQRSRWIKGFMQTYVVFCHNRHRFDLPWTSSLMVDSLVGFSLVSFFIPVHLLAMFSAQDTFSRSMLLANVVVSISYFIFAACIAISKQNRDIYKKASIKDMILVIIFIFYFVLHTIAAYMALFELMISPFYWNKTKHGVSKIL